MRAPFRRRVYGPLRDKKLENVLTQLFTREFGYEDKIVFAEVMVDRILSEIEHFVRPHTLVKPGQLLWMAVACDGSKHARKTMREIPQVPVLIDLVSDDDLESLANGDSFQDVRERRVARLFNQAFAQGGALAQSDVAAILLGSCHQVRNIIEKTREKTKRILPYRGSVHDMGGTITHKVEVIRLYEQGYVETEICRLLTPVHSLSSVEKYIQSYKNILKLLGRGFAIPEISGILSMSQRLVGAYVDIVREHHPDVINQRPGIA